MILDLKLIALLATGLVQIGNLLWYLKGVYSGETKPHAFSWLIWSAVGFIAGLGQLEAGGGLGAYLTCLAGFTCFMRGVAGLTHGVRTITHGDWLSFFLCSVAIVLWVIVKNPLVAIVIVTFIDLGAFYPTVRKSWNAPYNEPILNMLVIIGLCGMGLYLLAERNLTTVFYPAMVVAAHVLYVVMLVWRRRVVPKVILE